MLHDFVHDHREDLIARAAAKVELRPPPLAPTDEQLRHGVPVLLSQLETLLEQQARAPGAPTGHPAISVTAGLNGGDLQRLGFTVGQVVHCYGDVCQAITELAEKKKFIISNNEFHTLNRALDDAIASAVTEYGRLSDAGLAAGRGRTDEALDFDERNLLCAALLAWSVLARGTVGMRSNTAAVLTRSLEGLRRRYNVGAEVAPIPPSDTPRD